MNKIFVAVLAALAFTTTSAKEISMVAESENLRVLITNQQAWCLPNQYAGTTLIKKTGKIIRFCFVIAENNVVLIDEEGEAVALPATLFKPVNPL